MVMERIFKQRKRGATWKDDICPSIRRKLEKLKQLQRHWSVSVSGGNDFEVRHGYEGYHVDLEKHYCTCRIWQVSGIPCVHTVAALAYLNVEPSSYVSGWFITDVFKEAYKYSIKPLNGSNMWKKTPFTPPLPPKQIRMPGRPTIKRKKDAGEKEIHGLTRSGKDMTCSICKNKGHNKRGCKSAPSKASKAAPSRASQASKVVQTPSQVSEDVQMPPSQASQVSEAVQMPPTQASQVSSRLGKLPVKRKRHSERILRTKLSKPWFDKDGKGTSASNPYNIT